MPTDQSITFTMTRAEYDILVARSKAGAGALSGQLYRALQDLDASMQGAAVQFALPTGLEQVRGHMGAVDVQILVDPDSKKAFLAYCDMVGMSQEEVTKYALWKRYFGPRAKARRPADQTKLDL